MSKFWFYFSESKKLSHNNYIGSSETIDSHSMKIQYWTNEWETSELWKPDTLNVYTYKEFEYLKKFRFCFLGMKKSEIKRKLKHEREYPVRDGLALLYYIGNVRKYCNDKRPYPYESDENGCKYSFISLFFKKK